MSAHERRVLSLKKDAEKARDTLSERLHKVLANAGLGSRRGLESRIREGEVAINGDTATLGTSVSTGDLVHIDERQFVVTADHHEDAQLVIYNKPDGVLTTRDDPEGRPTVFDNVPDPRGKRWISVGRLDINTSGLLLLTTDGELANALMHPGSEVDREYLCRVQGELASDTIDKLRAGIELDDGPARFEDIIELEHAASHAWFRVTIREGRNREVRRMWEALGCEVSRLKRIRYGCISLPRSLKRGDTLALEAADINALRKLVGIDQPATTLTLKPVSRQRRVRRAEPPPKSATHTPAAWTGDRRSEARELSTWDRPRPDAGKRGAPGSRRRPGKEVNGNLIRPERGTAQKRRKPGRTAPGQELPAVRSWFAGDAEGRNKRTAPGGRPDGGRPGGGKPGGGKPGGRPGERPGNRQGKPHGNRGPRPGSGRRGPSDR